ncbi:MAG: hypothetical protein ABSE84_16330 [Isosphaeraceae bacterium]
MLVPLALVAPHGDGAEAPQPGLAGIDRGQLAVVVEDLQAGLRVEVERPLVPAGRRSVHTQPEQLVEPLRTVAGGGRVALGAPQVAGVEDADSQHPPVVLDQAPPGAQPRGFGVLGLVPSSWTQNSTFPEASPSRSFSSALPPGPTWSEP